MDGEGVASAEGPPARRCRNSGAGICDHSPGIADHAAWRDGCRPSHVVAGHARSRGRGCGSMRLCKRDHLRVCGEDSGLRGNAGVWNFDQRDRVHIDFRNVRHQSHWDAPILLHHSLANDEKDHARRDGLLSGSLSGAARIRPISAAICIGPRLGVAAVVEQCVRTHHFTNARR